MNKIVILLTSYNRRTITEKCLSSLNLFSYEFDIYLVDDNSTDGTAESVRKNFPKVNIIKGTGNLFWNRGMYLAWQKASKKEYDYYLWLNDDVILYPNCFDELFKAVALFNNKVVVSGVIESKDKSEILYCGYSKKKELVVPNGENKEIFALNGNVVLVPKIIFDKVGILDPIFHHDLGDIDYGLRVQKEGFKVVSTKCAIASGLKNSICRVRLNERNIIKRFKRLYSPLGSNPFIDFYFRKQHYGYSNAILHFVFLHFLNIIPDGINKLLFKEKYV